MFAVIKGKNGKKKHSRGKNESIDHLDSGKSQCVAQSMLDSVNENRRKGKRESEMAGSST